MYEVIILKNNIEIAKMMGYKIKIVAIGTLVIINNVEVPISTLKYDRNWNALMTAITKIDEIMQELNNDHLYLSASAMVFHWAGHGNLEEAYNSVVAFAKLYNKTNEESTYKYE